MTEMTYPSAFGVRLTSRMRKMQLNHHELANTIGVTRATVNRWITGETCQARAAIIPSLAEALECEIRWLTTGEGPEERDDSMSPNRHAVIREAYTLAEPKLSALLFLIASLKDHESDQLMVVKLALDEDERALIHNLRRAPPSLRHLLRQMSELYAVPQERGRSRGAPLPPALAQAPA